MDASEIHARSIFWTIAGTCICRPHDEPGVTLHVPNEESFPIPLVYIDVVRRTNTTWDVLLEGRIDDYWNVDGGREPIGAQESVFTQFTILSERSPHTDTRDPGSDV